MYPDLSNKSSAEIGNFVDAKEKELSIGLSNYAQVEQEKLLLQREILEKQLVKKDLEIELSKAGHNIKQLNIELKLLKSAFWNAKNSGL